MTLLDLRAEDEEREARTLPCEGELDPHVVLLLSAIRDDIDKRPKWSSRRRHGEFTFIIGYGDECRCLTVRDKLAGVRWSKFTLLRGENFYTKETIQQAVKLACRKARANVTFHELRRFEASDGKDGKETFFRYTVVYDRRRPQSIPSD